MITRTLHCRLASPLYGSLRLHGVFTAHLSHGALPLRRVGPVCLEPLIARAASTVRRRRRKDDSLGDADALEAAGTVKKRHRRPRAAAAAAAVTVPVAAEEGISDAPSIPLQSQTEETPLPKIPEMDWSALDAELSGKPPLELAQSLLQTIFGYQSFRHEQQSAIDAILAGKSSLVVFPTGAGKSLCFQIPALAFRYLRGTASSSSEAEEGPRGTDAHGITLVVSPLLALMKDQVDALKARGIAAERVDSTLTAEEAADVMDRVQAGQVQMLYCAPERLNNERFQRAMKTVRGGIRLLAVDEAHCISEWGHSFRPEYLKVARFAREIEAERVLCLTATATPLVARDICEGFGVEPKNVFYTRPYRPNLFLEAKAFEKKKEKWKHLRAFLEENEGPTIIYTTTQRQSEDLAARLVKAGFSAAAFHAGMPPDIKKQTQEDFMQNKIGMIVATIAFGMGIDKPDIRNIVHHDIPQTIEEYNQQIGRAGRDGKPSTCLSFLCPEDYHVRETLIRGDIPSPQSIEKLFHQVMLLENEETPVGNAFAVSQWHQSRENDIRETALSIIYAILELHFGLIRAVTAEFAQYRYAPSPEYLPIMESDESPVGKTIWEASDAKLKWHTINVNQAAERAGLPREALVDHLSTLQDAGHIELQAEKVRQRFKILKPLPKTEAGVAELARQVFDLLESRERDSLERSKQITGLLTAGACYSRALAQHFGMDLPDGSTKCGHCSFCQTGKPVPMPELPKPALDIKGIKRLLGVVVERDDPRFLTKIGFGIRSPRILAEGYHHHEVFGSLANQEFPVLLEEFGKVCA